MPFLVVAVLGPAIAVSAVFVCTCWCVVGFEERTLAPGGPQLLYLPVHLL